ncbi:protein translocation protein Sec62 family protein [Aspergillus parasiticus SU-1]|uniref:Translocation protein SEC62 n=3 Tax=Aspergillus subgen. Circumdati TaxID=2720871 RepID=A0A5N6DYP1_ASPPA|nr:translocation protein Sec62-domain-containing protein [Aspergillus parasiticus]KAE8319273.1 translocation protein Sec62-domain-containing protein [Aspergillus transmontanensis]KJK60461.1 protein translocation protein Sec62 family protein [Aspergillus parasiticus SU-1]
MAAPGQPSPQQIAAMQQQFAAEAARRGMTPEEFAKQQREQLNAEAAKHGMSTEQYVQQLRMRALAAHQKQVEAQRQGQGSPQPGQPGQPGQQGQQDEQGQQTPQQPQPQQTTHQVPVNPSNPPDPKAIAVAQFLRSQNLKPRTCIMDGQRKDMFKVKRAIRALESPAYAKAAAKKNSLLPPITDRASAENVFKLLPLSLLALRVSKVDPHAGHNHAKPKNRVKGLWTVKIEQHQETDPMMHYVWLYEGPQWKQKAMAAAVVAGIFAVVLFPLWPMVMRQGVWYLSVGMMGLLGLFFAMSIFRLILFCVTVFVVPPGLWLFPNLFEDVGFIDSFKPLWGWQESKKKKKSKKSSGDASKSAKSPVSQPADSAPSATTTATAAPDTSSAVKRDLAPRVEEVTDE